MRIPGTGKLRRAFEFIAPGKAVILMYHRVAESGPDPWWLSVTPKHFSEHLDVLRRQTSPTSLGQLTSGSLRRRLSRKAVVVTLDDGYADNLTIAAPLLRQHDVPATLFVTTAAIGDARGFWWDELADLLLLPGELPETLHLTIGCHDYQWCLGASARYTENDYDRHRSWKAQCDNPPTGRHAAYSAIWQLMQPLPQDEQRQALDVLTQRAQGRLRPVLSHRTLTESDVTALGRDGLIEIGSHSVTHPPLPSLPPDFQRREAMDSKRSLEKMVGKPVISFAYPHGQFSEATTSIIREAGFRRACTSYARLVRPGADNFRLPRIEIKDCDGEQFARRLARIFA
jgi:peptidoglycan/xylan/chitin deacetylase (PgdA/CDA1 family)